MDDTRAQDGGSLGPINYEREYHNLKERHLMIEQFADQLKNQMQQTEVELQLSRNECFDLTQNRNVVASQLDSVTREAADLKKHKLELVQMVESKNEEISRLKRSINNIQSHNAESGATELNSSLSNVKLKEIKLNFEEARLKNERALFKEQIEILSKDLETKNEEVVKLRKETNVTIMSANQKMEQQANEINSLHMEINRLKSASESNERNFIELGKNYSELKAQATKMESAFTKETEAQEDMIKMLMKQGDDYKAKMAEKETDYNEIRGLLKKAYEAHEELVLEFNNMKASYTTDVTELEEERNKLMAELEKSRQMTADFTKQCIENEFAQNFPLAYENSHAVNLISLSDLYNELVNARQSKETLSTENAKLKETLREMQDKLDEELPVNFRNIQNFKQMSDSYASLEHNMLSLLAEKEKFMTEKDNDTRLINTLRREVKRYEVECNNLSIQIQHLMKNLHQAQGFSMTNSSYSAPTDPLTIPLSLITFNDIADLQEKNRELIRMVHTLNEELDNNPSDRVDGDAGGSGIVAKLRGELDEAKTEIIRLENELFAKSEVLVRTVKQKRLHSFEDDTFDVEPKLLLSQNRELNEKVAKCQEEIERTRAEKQEEIRRLEDSKNGLVAENADLKANTFHLNAELDAKAAHIENLDVTLAQYREENVSLRERNIKVNATVENMEKGIIYLKGEIESLKETIKLRERAVQLANSERDLAKNGETNLINENARLKEDLENAQKTVYSLRAIQENVQTAESRSISSLKAANESLQKSNDYYVEKLNKEEEKYRHCVTEFSAQINNLRVLLDKEKSHCIELQRQNFDLQSQFQQYLEKAATAAQANQSLASSGEAGVLSGEQKKQLLNLQEEVKLLKGRLLNSEATCDNYKAINLSLEENLNQLHLKHREITTAIDRELAAKMETIQSLQGELEANRVEHEKEIAQANALFEQTKAQAATNGQQIEGLKTLLAAANEATRLAQENEQTLLDDLNCQRAISEEAAKYYETEMATRSGDSSEVFALRMQVEALQKSLSEKDTEIAQNKETISRASAHLDAQLKTVTLEVEKLRTERSSLQNVNETLLNQIEQLNNQIIALQNNSSLFALDETNQQETATQMMSVLKFLREEKAQLQLKLAKLTDEHSCLKIEADNFKKEIDSLKSALEIEKQSSSRLSNLNEFKDLVSKAELVPVLTENNSKLRLSINQLELRVNELTEKLARAEASRKEVTQMATKADGDIVEVQFLRNEVQQWKVKANSLSGQLKNFDSDSIKKLMVEKSQVSRQNQALSEERNKLKQELDYANAQVQKEIEAKGKLDEQVNTLQKVNVQLRTLARKYRDRMESNREEKASADAAAGTSQQASTVAAAASGSESNSAALEELKVKLQQKEEENAALSAEIARLQSDNEMLQKLASEKDEQAKKIAEKAKQRLSDGMVERNALAREIEALKTRILELQTLEEERLQQMNALKREFEFKSLATDKTIESLNLQLQQQQQTVASVPLPVSASTSLDTVPVPVVSATPSMTTLQVTTSESLSTPTLPARHSVLPQQQQPQGQQTVASVPATSSPAIKATASIKPLTVAASRTVTPSPRMAVAGQSRPMTVVQPTANPPVEDIVPMVVSSPFAPQMSLQQQSIPASDLSTFAEASDVSTSESQPQAVQLQQQPVSSVPSTLSLPSTAPSTSSGIGGTLSGDVVSSAKKRPVTEDYETEEQASSSQLKKMRSAVIMNIDPHDEDSAAEALAQLEQQVEAENNASLGRMEGVPQRQQVVQVEEDEDSHEESDIRGHDSEMETVAVDMNEDDNEEPEEVDIDEEEDAHFDEERDDHSEEEDDGRLRDVFSGEEDDEEDIGDEEEFDEEEHGDDAGGRSFDEEDSEEEDDDEDSLEVVDESDSQGDDDDDSSEIEVIALDDSSDEEAPPANARNGNQHVSSSHGASRNEPSNSNQANQSSSNELTTTTNEDGGAVPAQSNIFSGDFHFGGTAPTSDSAQGDAGDEDNRQDGAPTQSSSSTFRFSNTEATSAQDSGNSSGVASSSTAANQSSSARQPVLPPTTDNESSPARPGAQQPPHHIRRQLHVRGNRGAPMRRPNIRGPRSRGSGQFRGRNRFL